MELVIEEIGESLLVMLAGGGVIGLFLWLIEIAATL